MNTGTRQTVFLAPRYRDAWAAVAFLERGFGFERRAIHEAGDGSIAHGELRLGKACYGLSSDNGRADARNPWTAVRSGIYVALADAAAVDAHHSRAVAAGAAIAMPILDTGYGSHQYSVWDCDHHLWCFGTYSYAPAGDPALHVLLRYPEPSSAAGWLTRAFGFVPEPRVESGTASRYLSLAAGEARLWLAVDPDASATWRTEWHAGHVVVDDVTAHFERAGREGAVITRPLAADSDGNRSYSALDPEGYAWTFSSGPPREKRPSM